MQQLPQNMWETEQFMLRPNRAPATLFWPVIAYQEWYEPGLPGLAKGKKETRSLDFNFDFSFIC